MKLRSSKTITTDITKQKIIARDIHGEDDFWKVRNFLLETYPLVPPDFNWDVRRWDGSYHHNEKSGFDARWERDGKILVSLWETEDGKIVGAAHPEGNRGDAFLQLHPGKVLPDCILFFSRVPLF